MAQLIFYYLMYVIKSSKYWFSHVGNLHVAFKYRKASLPKSLVQRLACYEHF